MADEFEYVSRARLKYREVPEPVVFGVKGKLRTTTA